MDTFSKSVNSLALTSVGVCSHWHIFWCVILVWYYSTSLCGSTSPSPRQSAHLTVCRPIWLPSIHTNIHVNIHGIYPTIQGSEPLSPGRGSAASCSPQTCFNGEPNYTASSCPLESHTQMHQTMHQTANVSVVLIQLPPSYSYFSTIPQSAALTFHFFVRVLLSASA